MLRISTFQKGFANKRILKHILKTDLFHTEGLNFAGEKTEEYYFDSQHKKTIRLYFCIVSDLRLVHNQHSTSDETVQTSRPYIPLLVEAKTA